MSRIIFILSIFFITTSAQSHTIIGEPKDPDPCLNLAIPYDLCLQTIGKEWLERQRKNAPPTLESRIKQLEKQLKELQKRLDNKTS
jgi:hypothetical protein